MALTASIPGVVRATDVPGPVAPHVRSVVRVDARSHRLVRVFEAVRSTGQQTAREPDAALKSLVDETARTYDVSPELVHSLISVESGFNAYAVSPKGALGIMQLMPDTARRFGVANAFDVKQNLDGGVRYLRFLQDTFGNNALAVAAYNAGERAVEKYNGIPPYPETVAYVKNVSARYTKARQKAAAKSSPSPAAVNSAVGAEGKHPPLEMFYDEQGRVHIETR